MPLSAVVLRGEASAAARAGQSDDEAVRLPPAGRPAKEELLLSRPHAVDGLEQLKMPCLPFPTDKALRYQRFRSTVGQVVLDDARGSAVA